MDLLQDPRYKDRPTYLFFEKYIMDVVGELSDEKIKILQELNLQHIFGTQAEAWGDVIIEVLQLSPTIDIAILEQWFIQKETAQNSNTEIDPKQFGKEFVDQYFDEQSTLDQWTEASLANAKNFIYENLNLEKA